MFLPVSISTTDMVTVHSPEPQNMSTDVPFSAAEQNAGVKKAEFAAASIIAVTAAKNLFGFIRNPLSLS